MKKKSIQLTIGMMVYNEEKYIGEAIESLLNQTYKEFIFIISDNASTDRTSEICKYYAEKDKRIIFVRHAKNQGLFHSFKYVLNRTDTNFFMVCSGHDKWQSDFIEKLLPIIQKEKLILIYPKTREIKMDGKMGEVYEEDYTTVGIENPTSRYLYVLKNMGMCNAVYGIWKTKIIKDCCIKKSIIAGDVFMVLKATFSGKFKQYKEILFLRRIVRKETDQYSRQIRYADGEDNKNSTNIFSLKNKFVWENIKMLYEKELSLNFFEKIFLTIQTIYIWSKKLYIRLFLISVLKKILPTNLYYFLENKFKNKVKKYL
ncbi:MAG: glycosyltransferase family 2 protein [bacterium]